LLDRLRLCLFLVGHVGINIESCRDGEKSRLTALCSKSPVHSANYNTMPGSGERKSARDRVSIAWLRVRETKATDVPRRKVTHEDGQTGDDGSGADEQTRSEVTGHVYY
jgi:hypothetical protein